MPKNNTRTSVPNFDKKFRLPALIIIFTPILAILWYVLNTDAVGSVVFGEKLYHCGVLYCEVTRQRFLPVAAALGLLFLIGIGLLVVRTTKGGSHAAK